MKRIDCKNIPEDEAEIRLFMVGMDAAELIPHLFKHFFDIGVDRIFYIDNSSKDGSLEALARYDKVHVWVQQEPFSDSTTPAKSAAGWIESLTHYHGVSNLCLLADCDELFVYGVNDVDCGFSEHSLTEFMGNEMANIFGKVYEENMWGGKDAPAFYSGRGSNEFNTGEYRQYVQQFIEKNNITSVVDIGCGDFRVGKLIDWDGVTYAGIDVVRELVERNNKMHASQNVTFIESDAVSDSLPSADLCLIRQVFQHLSNKDIMAVLPKLKKYRFVLITDGLPAVTPAIKNADKPTDFNNRFNELYGSGLYLESAPFNLNAEVVLSYLSRNKIEIFRTLLLQNQV